jgi:hypothetical protein
MKRRQQLGARSSPLQMLALAALVLSFVSLCSAQEWTPPEAKLTSWGHGRWSTTDSVLEGAYLVLRYIDTAQTRTVAKNPDQWKEAGPVAVMMYGEHPSVAEVHKFNILMAALHAFISYQIDPPGRTGWQIGSVIAQAYVVNENRKLGIKPDWPLFGAKFTW